MNRNGAGSGRLLLLLPTWTYRTHDFMEAAASLGVEVAIGSDRRQALAERAPGRTVELDFFRPEQAVEEILAFHRRYPVRAVVGVDDDTVLLAALASRALGVPHNAPGAVRASRYKHQMRRRLAEAGLPSPAFHLFRSKDSPGEAARAVSYPCVLKPVFLSASQGVIRADDPEEFVAAFERIGRLLGRKEVAARGGEEAGLILVEDYVPGGEVALEGLLVGGRLEVLALFDKPDPLEGPVFEEATYVTPSRLPAELQEQIRRTTAAAAGALGLTVGPVHAELRFNGDGVYVVEVAARSIGGLCSRVLRFGAGISLEELILRQATGRETGSMRRVDRASGVRMLPVPRSGVLRMVWGVEAAKRVPGIVDAVITIPLDQAVEALPEGAKYLGFVFARGDEPEAVETALREAYRRLAVKIEPQTSE